MTKNRIATPNERVLAHRIFVVSEASDMRIARYRSPMPMHPKAALSLTETLDASIAVPFSTMMNPGGQ
jgi:hypothetical protein